MAPVAVAVADEELDESLGAIAVGMCLCCCMCAAATIYAQYELGKKIENRSNTDYKYTFYDKFFVGGSLINIIARLYRLLLSIRDNNYTNLILSLINLSFSVFVVIYYLVLLPKIYNKDKSLVDPSRYGLFIVSIVLNMVGYTNKKV